MHKTTLYDNCLGSLIAIGDIHGCLKPLQALIAELHLTPNDRLIFLGDYIDRGPDSKGVIDYLINLQEHQDCIFLLGNHEVLMMDYLAMDGYLNNWEENGAAATLASYSTSGQLDIPKTHVAFLNSCLYFYDTPDYFFVHGGLKPNRTIQENLAESRLHDFVWERHHLDAKNLYKSKYAWEKPVVCGHTPQTNAIVMDKVICIDTGCVYNHTLSFGKLTAIRLPERELVQVNNIEPLSFTQRWLSFLK
jgi:serine/threonine protein phosphatase 1